MSEEEREAARLLQPLRHYRPDVASGVDVERAMRTGKRTVLVRQVAGTVAGLVAVLGIAVTLTFPSGSTPPAGGDEFGATTQEFDIGSAAGFTPLTYETGVDRQRAVLTAPDLADTTAVVTMYAEGRNPGGVDWEPSGDEAPEVNGHAAYWLDEPVTGDGALELAWRWRTGAWGFVRLTGPDATRDRAHKVAHSVEPGADIRVTPAVRLPDGLVADAELTGTTRSIGDHERAELVAETRYTIGGDADRWITVGLRIPESDAGEYTEIDDRPAVVDGRRVTFLDDTGLFVEVAEAVDLGVPLTELAARLSVDPDFAWPSTPSPGSPTTSASTSASPSGASSSPSPAGSSSPTRPSSSTTG